MKLAATACGASQLAIIASGRQTGFAPDRLLLVGIDTLLSAHAAALMASGDTEAALANQPDDYCVANNAEQTAVTVAVNSKALSDRQNEIMPASVPLALYR